MMTFFWNFLLTVLFSYCYCENRSITTLNENELSTLSRVIIPGLDGTRKADNGAIFVMGGSVEHSGPAYFAALSSLKVGADIATVLTTEEAAGAIKSYSPDVFVFPFLHTKYKTKLDYYMPLIDSFVIGPGLGVDDEIFEWTYKIIEHCKDLKKPLVIDADGIRAVVKNMSIIKDYPSPGVILTPNHIEEKLLKQAVNLVHNTDENWYRYWGDNVAVLVKDKKDQFYSSVPSFQWHLETGGSGRRVGCQGDILAGMLGTFYSWALKSEVRGEKMSMHLAQSIAAYAAAKLTRQCNAKAYAMHGRSMITSDMLDQIHHAFDELFL